MSTPHKKVQQSGSPKYPSSPLVRTPKRSKLITGIDTPSKRGKQSPAPCDRSHDLYKRICQGVLDSTRTPPKILTPAKFFKSRTIAAPKDVARRLFISFCDKPVEYITDLERVQTFRGKAMRSSVVEMVMPFYNIQIEEGGQEDIEVVADLVQEIFDLVTQARSRRSGRKIIPTMNKVKLEVTGRSPKSVKKVKKSKQISEKDPEAYCFVQDEDVSCESSATGGGKVAASGLSKRKGTHLASNPTKKIKPHIYNNPDSSDEEDDIFISIVKPIISEEEKREMKKILGNEDEAEKLLGDETAAKCIVVNPNIDVNVDKKQGEDIKLPSKEVELEEII